LSLVRDFFGVEHLLIPPAVYREISLTPLVQDLERLPWLQIAAFSASWDLPSTPDFLQLGPGEQQAITLALQSEASLVLTNDNSARESARRLRVKAIDTPSFLLSCKDTGFLDREGIREVIQLLQEKDHYGFRREVMERLLS
jgi:predicted nucleic acid-binding protein